MGIHRRHRLQGFTLVEIVVSLGLLTVLLMFLAAAAASSVNLNEMMEERRVATAQAQGVLNTILATQELQTQSFYVNLDGSPKTLTFVDFGETAPPNLKDWVTTITITAYQSRTRILDGSVEIVGPFTGVDLSSAAHNPFEFNSWNDGNMFEITVNVTWTPAAWKRSGQTGTYQGVTLTSVYYPSPPVN